MYMFRKKLCQTTSTRVLSDWSIIHFMQVHVLYYGKTQAASRSSRLGGTHIALRSTACAQSRPSLLGGPGSVHTSTHPERLQTSSAPHTHMRIILIIVADRYRGCMRKSGDDINCLQLHNRNSKSIDYSEGWLYYVT